MYYAELQGSLRSKNTPLTDTRTSLEILGLKAYSFPILLKASSIFKPFNSSSSLPCKLE